MSERDRFLDYHQERFNEQAEKIAEQLRQLADRIDRLADSPKMRGALIEIQSEVIWGFANLNLPLLAATATEFEYARGKSESEV